MIMRRHTCPACNAMKHGIKSRRAFDHIGCEFDISNNAGMQRLQERVAQYNKELAVMPVKKKP